VCACVGVCVCVCVCVCVSLCDSSLVIQLLLPVLVHFFTSFSHPHAISDSLQQISNYLSTRVLFERLAAEHPDMVGPINPNNDLITKLFGDQGGY